jgi:hypothetical protein
MTQSIELAEKFQPILDEIYEREALTALLDAPTKPVNFGGADTVNVFKTDVIGLGTYSRANGYPAGQITATWEALTLSKQRGRAFTIDRMDDEETLGMAFGTLVNEFIRTEVAPEVDAIRFAAYATGAGLGTTGTLSTAANVLSAIDTGAAALDTAKVPNEGRLLFVASSIYRLLMGSVTRTLTNESDFDRRLQQLDDMTVIPVPQGRFYTAVTLDAGATVDAGGYSSNGQNINFMILHPSAVLHVKKHDNIKIFSPDVNQSSDGWLFQYRLYHDAFVYDNKTEGIYSHAVAAAS